MKDTFNQVLYDVASTPWIYLTYILKKALKLNPHIDTCTSDKPSGSGVLKIRSHQYETMNLCKTIVRYAGFQYLSYSGLTISCGKNLKK